MSNRENERNTLIVVVTIAFIVMAFMSISYYHTGYTTGFMNGHDEGKDYGYERGYDRGIEDEYRDLYIWMAGFSHDRVVHKQITNLETNETFTGFSWTSKVVPTIGSISSTYMNLRVGTRFWFNYTFWMNVTNDDFSAFVDIFSMNANITTLEGIEPELNAIDVFSVYGVITIGVDYRVYTNWDLGAIELVFDSTKWK